MNYLNGGYVMVKYGATQLALQKAYESKRPVIAYDSNMRGQFATISESEGTYKLSLLNDIKQKYLYVTYTDSNLNSYIIGFPTTLDKMDYTISNIGSLTQDDVEFLQTLSSSPVKVACMVTGRIMTGAWHDSSIDIYLYDPQTSLNKHFSFNFETPSSEIGETGSLQFNIE